MVGEFSIENISFAEGKIGEFVKNMNDTHTKDKKNVGNGYLPLHYYAV